MALSDKVRSEVFARDRAICAFSGLSVWVLDYGASPVSHSDWADHVRPACKRGKDTVENLVCASAFYNSKKSGNGADNCYLFRNGRPTDYFFWNHPGLSVDQADILVRHMGVSPLDWHFNRALSQLNFKLWQTYVGKKDGWTKKIVPAAARHLLDWHKKGGVNDFRKRGLVRYPRSPDIRLMLSIADLSFARGTTHIRKELRTTIKKLLPYYAANCRAIKRFMEAQSSDGRRHVFKQALANRYLTPSVRAGLKSDMVYLKRLGGPTAEFI